MKKYSRYTRIHMQMDATKISLMNNFPNKGLVNYDGCDTMSELTKYQQNLLR